MQLNQPEAYYFSLTSQYIKKGKEMRIKALKLLNFVTNRVFLSFKERKNC